MSKREVDIYFKVEGLDGYITNLDDLTDALQKAEKETKDLSKETDDLEKSSKKGQGGLDKLGKIGKAAFTGLKGAIAATGIGLLLTAIGSLVEWFKKTDAGAKVLQGSTAALGVIFEKISGFVNFLYEELVGVFENPKQALIDFGTAIKDNIISRFEGILNFIPNVSKAIGELFKGNFKEAGKIAFDAVAQVTTGVEGASDKIGDLADAAKETFDEIVEEVQEAVTASNNLIDAQNSLLKLQNDLLVSNATLNKELESQKKISEDTTRSYEERNEALQNVIKANEELAANTVTEALATEDLLKRRLALAKTDEDRREIESELAQATADRIAAEQEQDIVRLESAQLQRELDQEELDRKKSIAQTLEDLEFENIQDEEEAALKGVEIARKRAREELELQGATKEELKRLDDAFDAQRDQLLAEQAAKRKEASDAEIAQAELDAEKRKQLEQDVQDAKLQAVKSGLDAISALATAFASEDEGRAERNFKIQKALSLATATISGTESVINAYKTAQASPITALFPGYPAVQAGLAAAFAGAQIATIARSTFQSPDKPDAGGGGGGNNNINPAQILGNSNQNIAGLQNPGETITPGQSQTPIRTYVIATDVTNAQQANQQIENLSTL